MQILYIGSGRSTRQLLTSDIANHTIVAANNAWRIIPKGQPYYWVHSGDFPLEQFPVDMNDIIVEISHEQYIWGSINICKEAGWELSDQDAQFKAGYTIFFQGLYWIMDFFKPDKIGLLGFDHDYNPEKVSKWQSHDCPNIQNQFGKKTEKTIAEWTANFFGDLDPDSFYGHGTPDPMRLNIKYLTEKFQLAEYVANWKNIKLVNYSTYPSEWNKFPRELLASKGIDDIIS